ncbi:AraC family transcriptional regulator [Catenovulum sediminis]|uniref:Helix-turn-helix transcriptional regulator n=1 Tax=Catenovulum sediminis TaxID=1740262 RepID=A0ABV1REK2_9ALTE
MSKSKVYCEPFCIQKGYSFEIHHVSYQADDPYSCFMHFHQVHEIIVFEKIDGTYFYSQGQSQLKDQDIVFIPSLETHDFELTADTKSWYIIQFLPEFLSQQALPELDSFFQQGMHLRMDTSQLESFSIQVKWLLDSYQQDPYSEKSLTILKLILIWLAEHADPVKPPQLTTVQKSANYQRLQPVMNLFRHQAAVELPLDEAASLCHLSPSYFSRLFKSVFRCNFSEYANQHKLYSAARLLSQSNMSITDIAFELNFSSPSHFISLFKKQFGLTPKKYKTEMESRIRA